jgi:tetratricopeptide (TPR) repeat protein
LLVWVLLDLQRSEEALSQLERCRTIMANGEDWRGLAALMARAEGVVAAAEKNYSDAETQFRRSISICGRHGLVWDEAETLFHWGRALQSAADGEGAAEKFDAAIKIYKSHGYAAEWVDRVIAEKTRIELPDTPAPLPDQRPPDNECLFRREGEFWTVAYRGMTCRLKDMKGLGYIAHLIAHPGLRIHVLDLFAQIGGGGAPTAPSLGLEADNLERVSDLGGASEVLDSRARTDYRRRLSELRAELEEAENNNDPGRAERTRDELDSLTDGLSSALGLGGRSRRFTADTERARGTVSKSMSSLLRYHSPESGIPPAQKSEAKVSERLVSVPPAEIPPK